MSSKKLKNYTKNASINMLFSRLGYFDLDLLSKFFFLPYFENKVKGFFYTSLKLLKIQKMRHFSGYTENKIILGRKLEKIGLYCSLVENEKKTGLKVLRKVIPVFNNGKTFRTNIGVNLPFTYLRRKVKVKSFKYLAKGFDKYDKFYGNYSEVVEKRHAFLKILKFKRFFNQVSISRLFLHIAKVQKKYRTSFYYFFRKKRKISSLFHLYTLSSLKFREVRKHRKKVFKKLAWKVKKQKKWKRSGFFNLFRFRQRLSQTFYVPKHLEINYKTLGLCYLGYTDFKTTSIRIPFWLNLRKLLTFLF